MGAHYTYQPISSTTYGVIVPIEAKAADRGHDNRHHRRRGRSAISVWGVSVLVGTAAGPLILAIIVILFGFFGIALGAGFYSGAGWGWTAGVIIYVISIGLGIAEILYGGNVGFLGGIIRTVAGVVIPIYLTRQGPKSYFGRSIPPASTSS